MKNLIIGLVIAVLLPLFAYAGLEFIASYQTVDNAISFKYSMIDGIENSNFDSAVINNWIELGEKYGLVVNVENLSTFTEEEVNPCYYISVTYKTGIALFGIEEEAVTKGYAR